MTRRDMIIIAVLVNAGLLAFLFMMAINSDDDKMSSPPEIAQVASEMPMAEPLAVGQSESMPAPQMPIDEGDAALKEFQMNTATLPVIPEEGMADIQPVQAPIEEAPKAIVAAPEPVVEEAEPVKKMVEVTVKKGDSLDKIARANGTTIKAIKSANQLKTDRLDVGQVLKVPANSKKAGKAIAKAKTESSDKKLIAQGDAEYYTIKSGDNPWKIAKKYNIKLDDLLKLNNLDETKARNMKAGEKIRVK